MNFDAEFVAMITRAGISLEVDGILVSTADPVKTPMYLMQLLAKAAAHDQKIANVLKYGGVTSALKVEATSRMENQSTGINKS